MDSASCTMHGDLVFPGIDTTKAERWYTNSTFSLYFDNSAIIRNILKNVSSQILRLELEGKISDSDSGGGLVDNYSVKFML